MNETMQRQLKALRLYGLLENWETYAELAGKRNLSAIQWLHTIIEDEYRLKQIRATAFRLKRARIPEPYILSTYPFAKQRKLNRKKLEAVYDSFDTIEKKRNVIWMGPTGCGKTGLATAFLTQAIERGHTGLFITFPDLVAELYASIADHTQKKVMRKFARYDCLLIDEVGYVEVEPAQVGHFFTLLQKRHKKRPTLITSNVGFDGWKDILHNESLTAALLDRLTETSHIFNMKGCRSLRPKLCQAE
jgi:DNA replication protein DnaC